MEKEEGDPIDVKRKMTPSIPANYVTILQLRERWIKEKEQKQRKEQERRRNHHAEVQHIIVAEDPKKLQEEELDEKHWGGNSKKDESTDGGEARRGETKEETAAIESEGGEDEGLPEKKRGRRKRYDRRKKKRTNQEVEECGGSIKPPEYTVKENNTQVKDQKKEVGNISVEKAVETQFEHLSIKRVQVNKHLKPQTRPSLNRNPIETASMVWVKKKGQNDDERAVDGNVSGVKALHA